MFSHHLFESKNGLRRTSLELKQLRNLGPGNRIAGIHLQRAFISLPGLLEFKLLDVGVAQHEEKWQIVGRNREGFFEGLDVGHRKVRGEEREQKRKDDSTQVAKDSRLELSRPDRQEESFNKKRSPRLRD